MADGGFERARTDVQLGIVFVLVRVFVSKLELVGAGVRAGGGARRLLAVPEVRRGKALFCAGVGVARAADVALCLVHNTEQPGEHAEAAEGLGGEVGGAGETGVGEESEEAVGEVAEEGGEVCGVVLEGVAEVVCADDRGGVLRRGEEGVPLRPVRAVPGGDPLGPREPLDARGGGLELELRVLRLREERQPDRLWQRLEHRVSGGQLDRRGRVTARETIGPLLAFLVATITYTHLFFTPLSTPPLSDFYPSLHTHITRHGLFTIQRRRAGTHVQGHREEADARLYASLLWPRREMLQRLCPGLYQQSPYHQRGASLSSSATHTLTVFVQTTCVQNCTDKFLKHSERVGARFAEHNAGMFRPRLVLLPLSLPG